MITRHELVLAPSCECRLVSNRFAAMRNGLPVVFYPALAEGFLVFATEHFF